MKVKGHIFYLLVIVLLAAGQAYTYYEMDRRSQISTRNEMVNSFGLLRIEHRLGIAYEGNRAIYVPDGPEGYRLLYHSTKYPRQTFNGLDFPFVPRKHEREWLRESTAKTLNQLTGANHGGN